MEEAERLCDRVAVMDQGHVVALDTPDRLIALHGPGTSIEFSSHDADEASMRALDGVASAHVSGTSVRLLTRSPETVLAQLLHPDAAGRDGMSNLRVEHGALEDVFSRSPDAGWTRESLVCARQDHRAEQLPQPRRAHLHPADPDLPDGPARQRARWWECIGEHRRRQSRAHQPQHLVHRRAQARQEPGRGTGECGHEVEPAPARRRRGGGGDPARFRDAVSCRSAMCRHRRQSPT